MNKFNVSLSKKKEHLVFTETTFDEDGFQDGQKRGILAITGDPDALLEKATERAWQMTGEPDLNGFYKVESVSEENAVESQYPEILQAAARV